MSPTRKLGHLLAPATLPTGAELSNKHRPLTYVALRRGPWGDIARSRSLVIYLGRMICSMELQLGTCVSKPCHRADTDQSAASGGFETPIKTEHAGRLLQLCAFV